MRLALDSDQLFTVGLDSAKRVLKLGARDVAEVAAARCVVCPCTQPGAASSRSSTLIPRPGAWIGARGDPRAPVRGICEGVVTAVPDGPNRRLRADLREHFDVANRRSLRPASLSSSPTIDADGARLGGLVDARSHLQQSSATKTSGHCGTVVMPPPARVARAPRPACAHRPERYALRAAVATDQPIAPNSANINGRAAVCAIRSGWRGSWARSDHRSPPRAPMSVRRQTTPSL